ncbi:MAG TPA: phosphoadenosine phosphosulfate reductase family protein [Ktedonobacteraceae bacterium]|nr:phosphoadenosine phosphosulfate reductase family protein [Ktedonobacteraceae bacterium]
MKTTSLWEGERLTLDHALELSIESLRLYGPLFRHWAIAYSGGKDSTSVVVLVAYLIASGQIEAPESLTVLYADTRMELPPLQAAAMQVLEALHLRGVTTRVVVPALDNRFMVYMLGRGVPPPKNRFRWCTPQLKIEPMERALVEIRQQSQEKLLLLTGVRIGESAARDQRIALSCAKDGAECGQGWYQVKTPDAVADILAPCLHWRVCHVWDWLTFHAPKHGFPTQVIAEVYGGDEKEEINARTGCVGCNLASKDVALETVLSLPSWRYLAPLKRLRPLYAELTKPHSRLRKDGTDRCKDGRLAANPMRLGPLTIEARRYGLAQVLAIQEEVNAQARQDGRPSIDLINAEEQARILELIAENTWPQGWTGEEVRGDVLVPQVVADGIVQSLLLS